MNKEAGQKHYSPRAIERQAGSDGSVCGFYNRRGGTAEIEIKQAGFGMTKGSKKRFEAQQMVVFEKTTLKDLTSYLGKPIENDDIGDEMVHTFILKKNLIETYHHPVTGQLLHVEIAEANETSQQDFETKLT